MKNICPFQWTEKPAGKKMEAEESPAPVFLPHFSAYTVEEASHFLAVKDQRWDAAAAFSVLRAGNSKP
jgi:hypothetical protein